MIRSNQILRKLYGIYAADGWARIPTVERYLGITAPDSLSVDDRRNERDLYQELVMAHPEALSDAFHKMLGGMTGLSYEESNGLLDGLRFLQNIIALALWKHELPVSDTLEAFARKFDRLDVPHVRRRLYEQAQV